MAVVTGTIPYPIPVSSWEWQTVERSMNIGVTKGYVCDLFPRAPMCGLRLLSLLPPYLSLQGASAKHDHSAFPLLSHGECLQHQPGEPQDQPPDLHHLLQKWQRPQATTGCSQSASGLFKGVQSWQAQGRAGGEA